MKKFFIFLFALTFTLPAFSEAIKLKNGLIINGSIVDRSEYILKVQTSYGIISLNQREIEKIMPDLHRVFLKGGGEYVGTVVDLDDFNLTLNTDNGLVNIDVAQITSMEIYDYEEAEKQKKYVETKIEQETQDKTQEENQKQKDVATSMGTSGLSFDEDLEKVFPSKPQETEEIKYIYKTHEDTPEQIKAAAEEEEELTPVEKEQKAKEEALSFDQNKKRKDGKNYFAAHIGMLNTKLSADISDLGGPTDFEVSGAGVSFGVAYLRKLTKRFWYGGGFTFGMLPKKSTRYDYGANPGEQRDVQISGQIYDLNALFNFYINPQSPVRVYLTGGASVTSLGIDKSYADSTYDSVNEVFKWNSPQTQDTTQTVFGGNIGLGLEWTIDDINIGLETRVKYATLKKELSNSPKTNVLITLKTSWFF